MRILTAILIMAAFCLLYGCASPKTTVISSAGTIGPRLTQPLSPHQRILVVSTLRDIQIDIVGENIFVYQKLGSSTLPAAHVNPRLKATLASYLKENGYSVIYADAKNQKVDTIVSLTENGPEPLVFDVKCELSKRNIYLRANVETHLYLYKISVIDAHTLKTLTWITGSVNGNLFNTNLCQPTSVYSPQNFNELHNTVLDKLSASVYQDLSRTLGGQWYPQFLTQPQQQR